MWSINNKSAKRIKENKKEKTRKMKRIEFNRIIIIDAKNEYNVIEETYIS